MNTFKIGDWVTVHPEYGKNIPHVTMGKKYQIVSIPNADRECVDFFDDRGVMGGGWFHYRFIRAILPFDATWTYKKLYAEAQKREIAGRSFLNKAQLIDVLNGVKQEVAKKEAPKPIPPKLSLGMELKEKVKGVNYTASYALEFDTGDRRFHAHDVCHARLKFGDHYDYDRPKVKELHRVALCIEGHYKTSNHKETYRKFVEYMLNDSPWASCFITKKWEDAIGEAVYLNVEESNSRCTCAAIALRMGSEWLERLPVFQTFLDMGYDANTSWLGANMLQRNQETWSVAPISGGHDVLVSNHQWEDVRKFFQGGWHVEDKNSFRTQKGGGYSIFSSIGKQAAYNKTKETLKQFIIDNFKGEIVGKGWDTESVFTEKSVKDFMDIVANAIKKEKA